MSESVRSLPCGLAGTGRERRDLSIGSNPDSLFKKWRDRLTHSCGSHSEFRGGAFALTMARLTHDPKATLRASLAKRNGRGGKG